MTTETWWDRNLRQAQEWSDAIYNVWIAEVAVGIYVDHTPIIVGYDPQKLLPSPERLARKHV